MLLEGRGNAACVVSSIEPEENGKTNTVLSWKSGRSSNGTSYFQTKKEPTKNQKKQRCIFYSIREAKLPFISKKMVFENFEPGKKLSQQYVISIHFKRKQA